MLVAKAIYHNKRSEFVHDDMYRVHLEVYNIYIKREILGPGFAFLFTLQRHVIFSQTNPR